MNYSVKEIGNSVFLWSLLGLAFVIPLMPKIAPVFVGLLLVSWFISGSAKGVTDRWKGMSKSHKWMVMCWPLFYLSHVLGLIHTVNFGFAGLDLGIKVSLLILPLLLMLKGLSDNVVERVFKVFVVSTLVSVIYNLALALFSFVKTGSTTGFIGQEFSNTMHIGYYGLCLLIALMISFYFSMERLANAKSRETIVMVMFMLTYITGIILTGSKMSFLILLVFLLMAALYFARRMANQKTIVIVLGVLVLSISGLYFGTGYLSKRVNTMVERTFYTELNPESLESTMARRMTWDASLSLIKSHPLTGVGTGDIKDELMATYEQKGYTGPASARLNSHSQFLQSFAALGVFGFVFLLLPLLILLYRGLAGRDFLSLSFAVCLILALMTESMVEREAGVMIVALFFSLMAERLKT